MEVAVGTEAGLWQRRQSDAHIAESIAPSITLFALADGFGEVGRGVAAAPLALGTLRDHLRRRYRAGSFGRSGTPSGLLTILKNALDHANARLYAQSGSHEDYVGSGTSLTAVMLVGGVALVGHVGDARAYLLRVGRLDTLTTDDAMFADAAVATKTALPAKPRSRGLLWRSLGTQAKLEASISHVALLAGDQLVLCTDGIHRCIEDAELSEALSESDSAATAVERVLTLAKMRGNVDNATLIVGRELHVPAAPAFGVGAGRRRPLRTLALAAFIVASLLSFGAYWYHLGVPDQRPNITSSDR